MTDKQILEKCIHTQKNLESYMIIQVDDGHTRVKTQKPSYYNEDSNSVEEFNPEEMIQTVEFILIEKNELIKNIDLIKVEDININNEGVIKPIIKRRVFDLLIAKK